ncbi:KH domain-containing protein [Phormidium sp. CLA17]|uniref:KH domain-containing protein n=1 Tax=Leptolyngbya sp. Cla-17 TaxID=2803751 RepID=UPI0014919984|nr:KH domain-containing protein [Leptolyngbya sp. Cla-17]MBM0740867.1 KH domain-containing protein [Leptolyngbya sp. Cla-17]
MPEPVAVNSSATTPPDYESLIRFLVQPFLESPDALRLDCETSPNKTKVWVRLAFEGVDKGRVFGRGGRNIQAIRIVLSAIAQLAGQSIHLDVYGSPSSTAVDEPEREARPSAPRRVLPSPKRIAPRNPDVQVDE